MSGPIRRRFPRSPSAAALCLLLAWGWCAPAGAACSHQVRTPSDRMLLPSFLQANPSDPTEPSGLPPSSPPCRGALCSGSPSAPPVSTAAIRIIRDVAESGPTPPDPGPAPSTEFAAAPDDPRPIHRPDVPFRPPRPRGPSA